jgi:2'-phosphotransferase
VCIHGTNLKAWQEIQTNGISKMGRNHIHFSIGMLGDSGVTSGVRKSATVFIYINIEKALSNGIKFYKSENSVILSPGNEAGIIPVEYFLKVVNKNGQTL